MGGPAASEVSWLRPVQADPGRLPAMSEAGCLSSPQAESGASTFPLSTPAAVSTGGPQSRLSGPDSWGGHGNDESVHEISELRQMLLTTDELLGRGLSSQALSRAVTSGDLVRLRPGFYVEGAARKLPRESRHVLSILAADAALDSPVFSHSSAALLHGLPAWGLPLGRVSTAAHGARNRSRTTRLMTHHSVRLDHDDIDSVDGLRVTAPARTLVDVALTTGRDAAVTVADAAGKRGLVTGSDVNLALEEARGRPGIKKARAAMGLLDRRSESVAETRSRLTFMDHGLPRPETQVDILGTHGSRIARVDFLWREFGVIGECDGFGKYFDGADSAELRRRLAREKDRDAELIALGYRVLHWRWADLEQPRLLAERIRRVLFAVAA